MPDPLMPCTPLQRLVTHLSCPHCTANKLVGERRIVSDRSVAGIQTHTNSIGAGGPSGAARSAAGSTARGPATEPSAVARTRVDRHQEGSKPPGVEVSGS